MAEELKATAPADKKHSKTKKTTTKRPETYLSLSLIHISIRVVTTEALNSG